MSHCSSKTFCKLFCLGFLIGTTCILTLLFQDLLLTGAKFNLSDALVLKHVRQLQVIIAGTEAPSSIPTMSPSSHPSLIPSMNPSMMPFKEPTVSPTNIPTQMPLETMTNYLNKLLFNNNENLVKNFIDADRYIPLYNIDNFRRSRSIVGDITRVRMFIKKLIIDNKCVQIMAVGGSVTQGFHAGGISWAVYFENWLNGMYPNCTCKSTSTTTRTGININITNSYSGDHDAMECKSKHRVYNKARGGSSSSQQYWRLIDILNLDNGNVNHDSGMYDLIIMETATNSRGDLENLWQELILRLLLMIDYEPAIVYLQATQHPEQVLSYGSGVGAQSKGDLQELICLAYYQIPTVSLSCVIYPLSMRYYLYHNNYNNNNNSNEDEKNDHDNAAARKSVANKKSNSDSDKAWEKKSVTNVLKHFHPYLLSHNDDDNHYGDSSDIHLKQLHKNEEKYYDDQRYTNENGGKHLRADYVHPTSYGQKYMSIMLSWLIVTEFENILFDTNKLNVSNSKHDQAHLEHVYDINSSSDNSIINENIFNDNIINDTHDVQFQLYYSNKLWIHPSVGALPPVLFQMESDQVQKSLEQLVNTKQFNFLLQADFSSVYDFNNAGKSKDVSKYIAKGSSGKQNDYDEFVSKPIKRHLGNQNSLQQKNLIMQNNGPWIMVSETVKSKVGLICSLPLPNNYNGDCLLTISISLSKLLSMNTNTDKSSIRLMIVVCYLVSYERMGRANVWVDPYSTILDKYKVNSNHNSSSYDINYNNKSFTIDNVGNKIHTIDSLQNAKRSETVSFVFYYDHVVHVRDERENKTRKIPKRLLLHKHPHASYVFVHKHYITLW